MASLGLRSGIGVKGLGLRVQGVVSLDFAG